MPKLESHIAKNIQQLIRNNYNLQMTDTNAHGLARAVINQFKQHTDIGITPLLFSLLRSYYHTTKIPPGEFKKHSAFFFANHINRDYHLITIRRRSLLGRLLSLFIK